MLFAVGWSVGTCRVPKGSKVGRWQLGVAITGSVVKTVAADYHFSLVPLQRQVVLGSESPQPSSEFSGQSPFPLSRECQSLPIKHILC